jgi:FkbM family methyltransferase
MNIQHWILRSLVENCTILEAGVADGSDTLFFAENFPLGKIYGFEPLDNLYLQALAKTKNYKNVTLKKAALSYIDGYEELHISDRFNESWGSSSLLPPKDHLWFHKEITFKSTEKVKTLCLDDWIKSNNIDHIDLAWLDMQGYEPILLKNSPLAMSKIKFLYTEVSLIDTYDGVVKYPEYKNWLLDNGFKVIFEDLQYMDMGNVLFTKQEK